MRGSTHGMDDPACEHAYRAVQLLIISFVIQPLSPNSGLFKLHRPDHALQLLPAGKTSGT